MCTNLIYKYYPLSPSTELTFIGKKDTEITCTLTLTNTSDNSVLYKVHMQ